MLSALRHRTAALALGVCFIFSAQARAPHPGEFASNQARHIATYFPGRMTGSPAEMLAADYIRQQFAQMGYQSDIRKFNSRYSWASRSNQHNWQNVTGSTVIAAHEGKHPQQIIIVAHLDTYAPRSDADTDNNLGGLTLQGLDDNASGVGAMLELAEQLKSVPTEYTIRFVATSGEEQGNLGAENFLKRMSEHEKKQTLLVINLDNLIVGDNLYFNSGKKTPHRCVSSPVTGRWLSHALWGLARPPIRALILIILREQAAAMMQKSLIMPVFRCYPLRPPTGIWGKRMAISSARNRNPSLA
jgi:alkaline phosphatase isozyme conversion protein